MKIDTHQTPFESIQMFPDEDWYDSTKVRKFSCDTIYENCESIRCDAIHENFLDSKGVTQGKWT